MNKIDAVIKLVRKEFKKFYGIEFCCIECTKEFISEIEQEVIGLIETLMETEDERS